MAVQSYQTQQALELAILNDMKIAVDETIKELLIELQRLIKEEVYGAGTPVQYDRTDQFHDMWMATSAVITGKFVEGILSPHYNELITNKSKKQHKITGEDLVDLLIKGYGSQDTWYNQSRDFWTPFKDYVDANVEKIFNEKMNGQVNGITFNYNFS